MARAKVHRQAQKSLRVLVVEDDPANVELIKATLMQVGVSEIVNSKDGEGALDVINRREQDLDLIISEWDLPGMSGLELLREIRSRGDQTRFIIFTNRVTVKAAVESAEHGVTAFVPKPCDSRQLAEKILAAMTSGAVLQN